MSILSLWALSLRRGLDNQSESTSGPEGTVSVITCRHVQSETTIPQYHLFHYCFFLLHLWLKCILVTRPEFLNQWYKPLTFPPPDSAHLAKIITPIFLLLGCIILLWPQRKMWVTRPLTIHPSRSWILSPICCRLCSSSRLKNRLKEIFVYPAGMNIKASELHVFLNKVWTNHCSNQIMC